MGNHDLEIVLQEFRRLGWSRSALARASGVDKSTVSRIVRRITVDPDPETLAKLARGLGLDPAESFTQIELALEERFVSAARDAFREQLRQIRVELQRSPDPADLRGVAGIQLFSRRNKVRKSYRRLFRVDQQPAA